MKEKRVTLSSGNMVILKKTKTRCLRLAVSASGKVSLSLPWYVRYTEGIRFLESQEAWIKRKRKELLNRRVPFLRQGTDDEFRRLRGEARSIIQKSLEKYRNAFSVFPQKISIRNQKSRWGSCSARGTLSFSYRILLLPERLRDYIVVHELCHLTEFNHSPKFWAKVSQFFPDYQALRSELRRL